MWKQIYPRMIKLVLGIVGISVGNPIFLALLTEPRGLSKANAIPGVYYVLLWSPLPGQSSKTRNNDRLT